jgi:hypothetical protein
MGSAWISYSPLCPCPHLFCHDDLPGFPEEKEYPVMPDLFPEPIRNLPQADIPLSGLQAYLSQGADHQIIFMEFHEDVELAEHAHESQWGVVLEGRIDLVIDGVKHTFTKGDRYFIPKGVKHAGRIYAGYADITFFNQADRYAAKTEGTGRSWHS